jgi:phosphatidylserine/phosphatidylglycerophosphate/cardiolipin synthase-like enzyme
MVLGTGSQQVKLLVEPTDGVTPIVKALNRATQTVFVAAYILSHLRIVHALDRAEARGVRVYVELEPAPYGIFGQPQRMMIVLRAAGIAVRWRPAGFQYAHSKYMVIDDKLLVLSSANFSQAGFTSDRDFVLLDRSPIDVRETSNIFRADWGRIAPTLTDPNLVVSPSNSRSKLDALCNRAHRTLDVYAEEVMDESMIRRLAALARRGVRVRVIAATMAGTAKVVFRSAHVAWKLTTVGPKRLYVHAKVFIVDGRLAFVGSENLSGASLDANREVGLVISGSSAVALVSRIFAQDWGAA